MIRILVLILLLGILFTIYWYNDKILDDDPVELIVMNNINNNRQQINNQNIVQENKKENSINYKNKKQKKSKKEYKTNIRQKLNNMEFIDEESTTDKVFEYVENDSIIKNTEKEDELTFGSVNSNNSEKTGNYSNFTLSDLD